VSSDEAAAVRELKLSTTTMPTSLSNHPLVSFLGRHALWNGLFIRIFLAWFLPWLLDDGRWIPEVAYTDIDFRVFTDAANYISMGQSPYDRHTYRYTPFLAALLSSMPKEAGRYLFCIADTLCGWIIISYRRSNRPPAENHESLIQLQDALWWLYNPLAINICTRGSSESLMVLLPVLLTVQLVSQDQKSISWKRAFVAGLSHGVAIHSKLYPIIYSLSYMTYFVQPARTDPGATFPWLEPKRLLKLIHIWAVRLFTPVPLLFLVTSLSTFVGLTWLGVQWYGEEALEEGLLYHFSRVDHRHNYSMYWYWIYLAIARPETNLKLMGRLLLIPQVVLLLYSSLGIASHNLGLAMFVQTYLFVTHNKVITAQYFTWYLCLLPLCSDSLALTRHVQIALLGLGLSIVFWLGSAYCLEMLGLAVHRLVWVASVVYFFANVNLMGALLRSYKTKQGQKKNETYTKSD
jgi:phosphatidylinositol glycan class M